MKLNPLFKCFGSKWSGAKHYPQPKYNTIIEPFAGGAGYSLNYSDKNVVLAERNQNIYNLWNYLINCESKDILEIPLNLPEGFDIQSLQLSFGQKLVLKNF